MTSAPPTSRELATLLPREIRCAASLLPSDPELAFASLHPEERACVARAIPKRRAEFAVGRGLARGLLHELGFPDLPLLPGPDRAPCWPLGIAGSIAHDARECLVAVVRIGRIAGVGVDVEPGAALEERLWRPICTPAERERLAQADPLSPGRRAHAIFSAKEALYKCLSPGLGWPRAFQDVEIELDPEAHRFAATPALGVSGRPGDPDLERRREILSRVHGVLLLGTGKIATACWWEPDLRGG